MGKLSNLCLIERKIVVSFYVRRKETFVKIANIVGRFKRACNQAWYKF